MARKISEIWCWKELFGECDFFIWVRETYGTVTEIPEGRRFVRLWRTSPATKKTPPDDKVQAAFFV
ncbi:MAG TPA: hypothetical protein VIS48_08285 [Candidatus Kryptonia bacterium]